MTRRVGTSKSHLRHEEFFISQDCPTHFRISSISDPCLINANIALFNHCNKQKCPHNFLNHYPIENYWHKTQFLYNPRFSLVSLFLHTVEALSNLMNEWDMKRINFDKTANFVVLAQRTDFFVKSSLQGLRVGQLLSFTRCNIGRYVYFLIFCKHELSIL